jgi:chaperonin GroEL (HSP60 family)
MRHANDHIWFGVDVDGPEGVRDNMEAFVWEPSLVKINAINSATEAASLILSVDETVRGPQSENVSFERVLDLIQTEDGSDSFSLPLGRPCHREPLRRR